MIYNTKYRSNDTTESQKEKRAVLMLIFGKVSQKSRAIKVHILGIRCDH